MLSKLAYWLFVTLLGTAVARGIISATGLDVRIARMIQTTTKAISPNLTGIAWSLSGAIGLICLLCWQIFHVSDRLEVILEGERPALGSLVMTNFTLDVFKRVQAGRVDVRMIVELTNKNDFLVKFKGKVIGEVLGKGIGEQPIDGFIPATQNRLIVYDLMNVPANSLVLENGFYIHGWMRYDISYFSATSPNRTRRTARRISFMTNLGRDDSPSGAAREKAEQLFEPSDEIEE